MIKQLFLVLFLALAGMTYSAHAHAGECSAYEQIHPNFPLSGSHLSTGKCTLCSSCHVNGIFTGTPKVCATCHTANNPYGALYFSTKHFAIGSTDCVACHNTTSFTSTWNMDHTQVTALSCTSCHNGNYVSVYNADGQQSFNDTNLSSSTQTTFVHPVTGGLDCANSGCHISPAAGMNLPESLWQINLTQIHSNIGSATCASCHDGVHATGKQDVPTSTSLPNGHPVVTQDCGACHSTTALFKCTQAWDRIWAQASKFMALLLSKIS